MCEFWTSQLTGENFSFLTLVEGRHQVQPLENTLFWDVLYYIKPWVVKSIFILTERTSRRYLPFYNCLNVSFFLRCLVEDGTGEAMLYVENDQVKELLLTNDTSWNEIKHLSQKQGEISYQRLAFWKVGDSLLNKMNDFVSPKSFLVTCDFPQWWKSTFVRSACYLIVTSLFCLSSPCYSI